ncbi:SpoIVB peptidase [Lachnospiraceae bacterium MD1]|jgi:stage IV sporulation protein B|uniref:SpoIVB peptidase n=1 Tax=Variimorphobacter saccharofermentans TaxID=2755051 RepID=A0A839JYX6_9FIRM|nr:SpoIVB peptidase [Variimorphobacter saccharofermentans]MBB2182417.1 SpoIVB peptidase [Variimorphobacter saccharofermentans]
MRIRKKYRKVLIYVLLLNILVLLFLVYYKFVSSIPDEIKIMVDTEENFDFNIPMEANIETEEVGAISVNDLKVPSNQIKINLNEPFRLTSSRKGKYSVNLKLFGLINFKNISLDVIEASELIPCGNPIGIYVETDGILVLGSGRITGEDGLNYEPITNKLKSGDYILAINNTPVLRKKDLINEIQNCNGKDITLLIRRNEEKITVRVTPVRTASGSYKIGAWIRDNTQGIGTLTFISPDGQFGALGHGITDIDTGLLMEVKAGTIYGAEIMSIIKGKEGEPGELIGMIRQSDKYKLGSITNNTYQGIFGKIIGLNEINNNRIISSEPLEMGLKQEVERGKATIRCTIEENVEDYEIEIESVDISNSNHSKGMVIRITDQRLLDLTGGIVQGMSGSPIIQNNKIIGAVTHVFIQDSTKGYGTFIENMVNNLE